MHETRIVNPGDLQVDPALIDHSRELILGFPDLESLSEHDLEDSAFQVAQMISAVEMDLFDAPIGAYFMHDIQFRLPDDLTKRLIVFGIQSGNGDGSGVETKIRLLSEEEFQRLVSTDK